MTRKQDDRYTVDQCISTGGSWSCFDWVAALWEVFFFLFFFEKEDFKMNIFIGKISGMYFSGHTIQFNNLNNNNLNNLMSNA